MKHSARPFRRAGARALRARAEAGFVLAWVMIVVFVLVTMGSALLYLSQWHGVVSVKNVAGLRAFNLAEAGLEWGMWQLTQDAEWTGATLLLDGESCNVAVASLPEAGWRRITAVASVGPESRTVSTDVHVYVQNPWPAAFSQYAIFWEGMFHGAGDHLSFSENMHVWGNVFLYGDIDISGQAKVHSGVVFATGEVTGDGMYALGEVGETLPPAVQLDTAWYDAQLATAATREAGGFTLNKKARYALNGQTLYVNGDVLLTGKSVLTGPGTIVATGTIRVTDHANVTNSVSLVAGNELIVDVQARLRGAGTVLYGGNRLEVSDHAKVDPLAPEDPDDVRVMTLITPPGKPLEILDHSHVRGVVFGGAVRVAGYVHVRGSIYGKSFVNNLIGGNVHIWHHPEVFYTLPVPPGIPPAESRVWMTVGTWREGGQ